MRSHLNHAIQKTLSSTFITRSKILLIGTMIAQMITFFSSLIVTNYYHPEDLGLLGVLTALVSIVAGTLTFRLDLAIIQSDEDKAIALFIQSTLFSMGTSLAFCLICFFLPWEFAKNITTHFAFFVLWTWGYFIFFNSKNLNIKFNYLTDVNRGAIGRSILLLIYSWISGVLLPTFMMLLSGRVLSDYIGALFHFKKFKHHFFKKEHFQFQWKKFLKQHSDYFWFMTPHHLCIALSSNIFIFFIESRFGLYQAGLFALAQRLIQAPVEMLGNTLTGTASKRFSELKHSPREMQSFLLKMILFSSFLAFMSAIFIYFTVDYFFFFLKEEWQVAGSTVKALTPYFGGLIIINPLTSYLRVINRASFQLLLEVIEIIIKITFLSLINSNTAFDLIWSYSLLTLVMVGIKTVVLLKTKPLI